MSDSLRPQSASMYTVSHFWKITRACFKHGPRVLKLARTAILQKKAVQRTWELMSLVGLVRSLSPNVILEIGTHNGGTLFCWPQVATDSALIISLDLPGGRFGGGYAEEEITRFEEYLRGKQSLKCLRADSHLKDTFERILAIIDERLVDFLFIDGDHTYEGVKSDFEMYGPLVRSGGLIAFHDINPNPAMPECGVPRLWREISFGHKVHEFVDAGVNQYGMGIGVLEKESRF